MLPFLLDSRNIPFAVAITVLLGLLAIELMGAMVGFSAMRVGETDASVEVPDGELSPVSATFGWLYLGKIPIVAWLAIFAGAFGALGYALQSATAMRVPTVFVAGVAAIGGMICTRVAGGWLYRHVFRDETTAVSAESLVGHVAVVTLGRGVAGSPTQAKVRDPHGQTHYVLVEPEQPGAALEPGTEVILLRRDGPKYFAVSNSNEAIIALDQAGRAGDAGSRGPGEAPQPTETSSAT
ncbi:MAG: DUF1449 family protein [Fimbriimonadaceae bacterium]|nr:DUF1449 family protein [Fimbriimonadaceae bacterium]